MSSVRIDSPQGTASLAVISDIGADAAGDVAAPAPIADDRKHILVVGVGRRDRFVGLGATRRERERDEHDRRDESVFHERLIAGTQRSLTDLEGLAVSADSAVSRLPP